MPRKNPAHVPHFRPVSQKAYDTFVRRIYAVVPKDNRCADMIDALDRYLAGDRDTYADALDEHTAVTFEMLRFEIDAAIMRSARARRPRKHRDTPEEPAAQSSPTPKTTVEKPRKASHTIARPTEQSTGQPTEQPTEQPAPARVMPRWERRAAIIALRPKNKWKKIG